jgi:hypothetical protein
LPFVIFIFAGKPNLIISKHLIKDSLLPKYLHKRFDVCADLEFLLQLLLSLLNARISPALELHLVFPFALALVGSDH